MFWRGATLPLAWLRLAQARRAWEGEGATKQHKLPNLTKSSNLLPKSLLSRMARGSQFSRKVKKRTYCYGRRRQEKIFHTLRRGNFFIGRVPGGGGSRPLTTPPSGREGLGPPHPLARIKPCTKGRGWSSTTILFWGTSFRLYTRLPGNLRGLCLENALEKVTFARQTPPGGCSDCLTFFSE